MPSNNVYKKQYAIECYTCLTTLRLNLCLILPPSSTRVRRIMVITLHGIRHDALHIFERRAPFAQSFFEEGPFALAECARGDGLDA